MAEDDVEKVISTESLVKLLKRSATATSKASEITGELGEAIKRAADKENLHVKAFRVIASMDKMEDIKRADYVRSLRLYLDKMEESQRWDLSDMLERAEEESEGKVTSLKKVKQRKASGGSKTDKAVKEAADRAEETARRKRAAESLDEGREPGESATVA